MKKLQLIAASFVFLGLPTLLAQEGEKAITVAVGEVAPDFTLTSSEKKEVSLSDYEGKRILLIFSRAH